MWVHHFLVDSIGDEFDGRSPALAEEPTPPKIPIAAAMRDFQRKYAYPTYNDPNATPLYYSWPSCWTGTRAPAFPPDDFYDADLEDPEVAAGLVRALSDAFFQTHLYVRFLKYDPLAPEPDPDNPSLIEQMPLPPHYREFTSEDFPSIGVINASNYVQKFEALQKYLNELKVIKVNAEQIERVGKTAKGVSHRPYDDPPPEYPPNAEDAIADIKACWSDPNHPFFFLGVP